MLMAEECQLETQLDEEALDSHPQPWSLASTARKTCWMAASHTSSKAVMRMVLAIRMPPVLQ